MAQGAKGISGDHAEKRHRVLVPVLRQRRLFVEPQPKRGRGYVLLLFAGFRALRRDCRRQPGDRCTCGVLAMGFQSDGAIGV